MNQIVALRAADFSNNQLALIRRTVAADTNQDEFELFVHTAKHLRLDPLRKQIYAFVFSKNDPKKRRMSIITAIDGFRAIADRTGAYRPDEEEPSYEIDPALKSPLNPIGLVKASVRVWKHAHGAWHKVTASSYWDEYAPIKDEWMEDPETGRNRKSGKQTLDTTGNWGKMPRLMLAKVAEALALRKAWPDDFSNVYAAEEIDRVRAQDVSAWEAADQAQADEKLARIGMGQTILFQFDPSSPVEPVPVGKVADRIDEFLQANREEPSIVGLFQERNRHALREFWARSPGDALEVKKMIESAIHATVDQ